jgi:hypothetical protein
MADNPGAPRQAQKIAVANNAALVVAFTVQYKDSQGKEGFSPKTDQFPFAQSATVDLTNLSGVKSGVKMRPRIAPVGGAEKDGPEVEFAENGLTATYAVTGNLVTGYEVALL